MKTTKAPVAAGRADALKQNKDWSRKRTRTANNSAGICTAERTIHCPILLHLRHTHAFSTLIYSYFANYTLYINGLHRNYTDKHSEKQSTIPP